MEQDKNDSTLSYTKIDDDTHDDSINTLEKTAKKVANVISKSLGSGAKAAEKKALEAQELIDAKQVGTEEQLATENIAKIENLAKQPNIDGELASFEGRYPKDLFNKSVFSNDKQTLIGHVTKETDSLIVVFSDSDNSRFDIPKSKITVDGGSVVLNHSDVSQYRVDKETPLPEDKSLRPSAKEIIHTTKEIEVKEEEPKEKQDKEVINIQDTTADALIKESQQLANRPRPATTTVRESKPESYHYDESEIVKKVKHAASDLKDIILSTAKIAERKVKEVREAEEERQVERDAEYISKMGEFATQFTNSFEDVLSEIRTKTYAEQEQIYLGFIKLIDQQRELILARKDLATRLKASVRKPVVALGGSEDIDKLPKNLQAPQLQEQQQPQLPEEMISQEQLKEDEPFIMADEPTEQTEVIQKSSQALDISTEIPSTEIQSDIIATDENEESRKRSQLPKKSKHNKKISKERT
ncbi:MAG TPA: hypothetical protein VE244_11785 [Nitrososphaeraceae archaeon]|jgi:hypothetical protein|nr:hypothetical protein [Nitrososphaeraceae archaeon]